MRLLTVVGVCVLLLNVNIEAAKSKKGPKNQTQFWQLWDTDGDTDNDVPGEGNQEFVIDDYDGSGVDNDYHPYMTHEDDEDFPNSGDGEPEETGAKVIKEETQPGSTDDEDDLFEESGSGAGEDVAVVDIMHKETGGNALGATLRPKPLTACEQLRSTVFSASGYIPECDINGEFKKKQCAVDLKTKTKACWCVTSDGTQVPGTMTNEPNEPVCDETHDLDGEFKKMQCEVDMKTKVKACWCMTSGGTQVPGTKMNEPKEPDCDFGTNLKGCVFQLVQNSQNLLGAFTPRCDLNGDWEQIQCHGSQCWCVDENGNQIVGSVTDLPNMPECDTKPTMKPVDTTKKLPKPVGGYTVDTKDKNVVVTVSDKDFETVNDEENLKEGYAPVEHQREPILGQPGFLAAIIAGGVITLLLIVLLVMFIVYRMRKKDEGSYPLDEQKYQNYSYAKAPDKEFYA